MNTLISEARQPRRVWSRDKSLKSTGTGIFTAPLKASLFLYNSSTGGCGRERGSSQMIRELDVIQKDVYI